MTGPSIAERTRSACARATTAMLAVPGSDPEPVALHHLRSCGDVVLAVSSDSPVTALAWMSTIGLPGVLELTDHAPLPLREPVRALVWLRGTIVPVEPSIERALASEVAAEYPHAGLLDVGHTTTLLRLRLDSAVVADATGAEPVDVDELRFARPDPFWELEAEWLQHLDEDHPDVIDLLARRLPRKLQRGRVRPLALDRFGLTLRVESDIDNDVRLEFPAPVTDVESLSKAVRILMGCPFLNGLRRP